MTSTRIKLIALDVDGTLVGSDSKISDRVRDAIVKAKAQGVQTTLVTGRMFAAAKPFAQTLAIDGPVVCYQGAAIFEVKTGAILREIPVRQDVTREVLQWAHDRHVHAQGYFEDRLYVEQINRFSKRYTDLAKVEPAVVPALREFFADRPSIKIVFVDDPEPAAAYLAELTALLGARAYITRSNPDFVEVLAPDINKGEALAFVAGRYGATVDEVMAVGDAWNDVPLIGAAGIGVAMGSGPPELFAQADYIVGDVAHDGVAEAIEKYVLT